MVWLFTQAVYTLVRQYTQAVCTCGQAVYSGCFTGCQAVHTGSQAVHTGSQAVLTDAQAVSP